MAAPSKVVQVSRMKVNCSIAVLDCQEQSVSASDESALMLLLQVVHEYRSVPVLALRGVCLLEVQARGFG